MNIDTIIALLRNMDSHSIDWVILCLEAELRARDDEEQDKQDYDALCLRDDMLHGRTNALEGIK